MKFSNLFELQEKKEYDPRNDILNELVTIGGFSKVWPKFKNIEKQLESLNKAPWRQIFQRTILDTVEDIKYLPKLREIKKRITLTYPLGLEIDRYINKLEAIIYPPKETIAQLFFLAPKMSKYAAKYIKRYVKENNLQTIHVLCGLAHESEIAFFLRNPTYPIKL